MTRIPATIRPTEVIKAVKALGIDPDWVHEIRITPDWVYVVYWDVADEFSEVPDETSHKKIRIAV